MIHNRLILIIFFITQWTIVNLSATELPGFHKSPYFDETGAMSQPTYIVDSNLPAKPASFGVISEQEGQIKIIISPDDNVGQYQLFTSPDGLNFYMATTISSNEYTMDESFSSIEQVLIADYLKCGGRLFVSGAEIAWDLDYKGSTG